MAIPGEQRFLLFFFYFFDAGLFRSLAPCQVDVYSFGIVMWELLTGEEPYADMNCASIIGENSWVL